MAYSPQFPPERDYFFQYSWVVPGILRPGINKRRHHWFGEPGREHPNVRRLFRFWNQARRGVCDPLFVANGSVADPDAVVSAPIAAYRHADLFPSGQTDTRLILMQHGSYHICAIDCQPQIASGEVTLYRGIQTAKTFLVRRLRSAESLKRVLGVHARSLTDSVISFNAAHCNLMRTETGYLNDNSFLFDGLCREVGLDPKDRDIRSVLYSGYAIEKWCASSKFGPNYVKFRTPLTNIRLTTFVAGETEVKVIDPNKLEVVEAVGCKVREVHL